MAQLRDLSLSRGRVVPVRLLSVRFARSGGPGGQNVNKLETKADLRLDLTGLAEVLGAATVARIREKLANRLDGDDNLQVTSDEHRSQSANVEAALSRMESLLRGALVVPKARRKTKPTRGSKERRLKDKRERSQIKKWRSGPKDD